MESFRTQNIAQVKEKGHNKEIANLAGENPGKIDCSPFFFLLLVLWDKNTDVTIRLSTSFKPESSFSFEFCPVLWELVSP